jgi:hypothetical protein
MKDFDELRFARLCDGGRLAHYLTPGMIAGAHPRLEFFATRESVQRRYDNRVVLNLPVEEERRALAAFRLAAGESDDVVDALEFMTEAGSEEKFWSEEEEKGFERSLSRISDE